MANTFDVTPYAYPPKRWLLLLLGLPGDATNEQYQRKFNEVVLPLIQGGSQAVWNKTVQERQKSAGGSFEEAWAYCRSSHPDLYAAIQKENAAKHGGTTSLRS